MTEDKDKSKRSDGYDDFLAHVSQFTSRDEERAFMEHIDQGPPQEDLTVNVAQRVKRAREERGLSLLDVSRRTGIEVPLLSEIEEGQSAPPLGTIIKLAKALNMRMGYFISGDELRPFTIVRRGDRKVVSRYDSKRDKHYGYGYESLAAYKKDRHMEPFLVTLQPSTTEEERSTHDGQEFIFVLSGRMEVRLGEEIHVLEPGDAIYYDSTVPHLVKCHGQETTRILAVLYAEK
ncbi:MAG: XRE family transcriptional regulator [Desulfobacterota bacterium]|jgi:transcriptional regulator with XRE-family HTH domain|nr:XRE family transcriptional regulator [Thermodesulfobacteriota bacterium]